MLRYERASLTGCALRPIYLLLGAIVMGCAGATVAPQTQSAPIGNGPPATIYVYPFAATAQDVTLNQGFFPAHV